MYAYDTTLFYINLSVDVDVISDSLNRPQGDVHNWCRASVLHIFRPYTLMLMYLSFCADGIDDQTAPFSLVERLVANIRHWILHDKLELNNDKTEFLIVGKRQQLAKVSFDTINVGSDAIFSVTEARGLGV